MKRIFSLFLAAMLVLTLSFSLAEEFVPYEEDYDDSESYTGDALEYFGDPDDYSDDNVYVAGTDQTYYNDTEEYWFGSPVYMYVYTENGGTLNVRSEPDTSTGTVIGRLDYGARVKVLGLPRAGSSWYIIEYSGARGDAGYVMQRFLVDYKPAARSRTSSPTAAPSSPRQQTVTDEAARNLQELNKQLTTAHSFTTPLSAIVRASRPSGWVNFRVGPGMAADRITTLPDGHSLTLIGETDGWYQAIDPDTGRAGYINKNFVSILAMSVVQTTVREKAQLGTLDVNGKFTLQCLLPDGYQLQVINAMGSRIIASITSADPLKPILYLSIAYNELYSEVERLNDLGAEDLAVIENSFTSMNQVSLSYRETSHGTKLLLVRETGNDTDFSDIYTVYKGYSIEFVMTPSPKSGIKTLTESQIQMCVDFLSDLDFVAK